MEDRDYLADPDQIHLLPNAAEAIVDLNRAGLFVVVVTNQSGIARGLVTEEEYALVASRLESRLGDRGARIDATYYCPHGPDDVPPCECRKPLPGMFERAARDHGLDLKSSFYIGDRSRDVIAGIRAGGVGYLIEGTEPDGVAAAIGAVSVRSLREAVDRVLGKPLSD
jgi:histidinol-phosphate phosphatase family protein